jgi:hypothetical protein
MIDEGLLHWVQCFVCCQTFDSGDLGVLNGDGEHQTAVRPSAIDQDRARPTLTVIATLLGTSQVEMLAKGIEQRRPVVKDDMMTLAVDS